MRTTRRAAVVAAFATAAAFMPAAAAPSASGRWQLPIYPHPDAHSVSSTSPIASGPTETAAVWSVAEDVYTASFDGFGWSPPVLVMGLGQFPKWNADACIAADPDGGFWIAARGPTDYGSIFVTHGQGTAWSAPVEIGVVPDGNLWEFTIGAASGGRAMAVFARGSGGVASSRFFDGTSWGDVVPTGARGVTLDGDFAMAADGTALIAWWDRGVSGRPVVQTARWKDGAWSAAFGIAIGMTPLGDDEVPAPQVSVAPDGTARAAWTLVSDFELVDPSVPEYRPVYRVETRAFDGLTWGDVDGFDAGYGPHVAVAGSKALLTFARPTRVKPDFYVTRPMAAVFDGAAWSAPIALDSGHRGFEARCVLAADGTGFVTWNRCPAGQSNVLYCDGPATQYGARFDGASFETPAPILPGVRTADNGRIATAPRSSVALIGPTLAGPDESYPDDVYLGAWRGGRVPRIARVAAKGGLAPGAAATIVGSDFGGRRGTVSFDGVAAPSTSWSPSRIATTLAPGESRVHLGLVCADGRRTFVPVTLEPPAILRRPTVAAASLGRRRVTLHGRAFGAVERDPGARVSLNGVDHGKGDPAIVRWTNTSVTLLLPAADATGEIYVTTSAGYDFRALP